jgi:cation:H+ antiporter
METINNLISTSQLAAWITLVISFGILAKAADVFVDKSVLLAEKLKIPKLIIGLILVSLATTAPELSVSLVAAIDGNPAMALGNAIGSIICNTTLGLGLCGLTTITAIKLIPQASKATLSVLFIVEAFACFFVFRDKTLYRTEGIILLAIFVIYIIYLVISHIKNNKEPQIPHKDYKQKNIFVIIVFFIISVSFIIFASKFIVISAASIAYHFHIKEAIVALTLVALGTSIPEVATCITAARKGQGDIAVGNILGANIMNICWVAGGSAIVNNLTLDAKDIYFMFPAMFAVTITMAILILNNFTITKKKGAILLALYIIYMISFFIVYKS